MSTITLTTGLDSDYGNGERWVIPLTTVWNQPARCSTRLVPDTFDTAWLSTCAPPAWEEVWINDGYYSPGVCPMGYTVGCSKTDGEVNDEPITGGQTAGLCVPSDFKCLIEGDTTFWATVTVTQAGVAVSTRVPAIQIRWESDDLSQLSIDPTLGSAVSLDISVGQSSSGDSSGGRPSETGSGGDGGGGGISTGAIVGIVVGVVVILALIGAGAFLLWRKRSKQTAGAQYSPVDKTQANIAQTSSPAQMAGAYYPPQGPHGAYPPQNYTPQTAYNQPAYPAASPYANNNYQPNYAPGGYAQSAYNQPAAGGVAGYPQQGGQPMPAQQPQAYEMDNTPSKGHVSELPSDQSQGRSELPPSDHDNSAGATNGGTNGTVSAMSVSGAASPHHQGSASPPPPR